MIVSVNKRIIASFFTLSLLILDRARSFRVSVGSRFGRLSLVTLQGQRLVFTLLTFSALAFVEPRRSLCFGGLLSRVTIEGSVVLVNELVLLVTKRKELFGLAASRRWVSAVTLWIARSSRLAGLDSVAVYKRVRMIQQIVSLLMTWGTELLSKLDLRLLLERVSLFANHNLRLTNYLSLLLCLAAPFVVLLLASRAVHVLFVWPLR